MPTARPELPTPAAHPRRGFALLVTIVLVAFLVLILVGLASFTRVETQVAANSQQIAQARQNALMALNIALGQLQQTAGPDQRVTARAEILDTSSTTLRDTVVKQPLWTAVWPTGPASLDIANSGPPQRQASLGSTNPSTAQKVSSATWLVSRPTPATTLDPVSYAGVTTGSAPDAVELAKNLGPDANITVTVPLVPVTATPAGFTADQLIGRYGYWVSDEGLKAKVNLPAPSLGLGATTTTGQAHFLAPQANAMHKIADLVTAATDDFRTANSAAQLDRVLTLDSVRLLPSSPSSLQIKRLAPSITTHSQGVLANVRHGGLKKDLTAAFETPSEYTKLVANHGYGASMLYRNDPALTVPYLSPASLNNNSGVTDGLPWLPLYAYYNTYKASTATPPGLTRSTGVNSPATPSTAGSLASLPLTLTPRILSTRVGAQTVKLGGIAPEIIAFRLDITLSSEFDTSVSPPLYRLRLNYYPQLVVHNPYNARLDAADFQFQRDFGAFATAGAKRVNITVTVDGVPVQVPNPFPGHTSTEIVLNQITTTTGRFTLKTAPGAAAILEPGETRIFGLSGPDVLKPDPVAAITFDALTSDAGLSPDVSQYCYLPGFAGTPNGSAVVAVTISDRRLRSQNTDTFILPHTYKWPFSESATTGTAGRFQGGDGGDGTPVTTTNWPAGRTLASLDGNPLRLTGFFSRKKGLNNSGSANSYANGTAVTAPFHGNAPHFSIFDNKANITWSELYLSEFGTAYGSVSEVVPIPNGAPWATYFGDGSVGTPVGAFSRRVLRDIPNQPLVSLGQFMHMPSSIFRSIGSYEYRDTGHMFVGGSLTSPFVPADQTTADAGTFYLMDDSFLANEALFDRFFFSTVPPAGATTPQLWADFNTANPGSGALASTTIPLPNSRLKPSFTSGSAPLLSSLRDFDQAAANLLLDGAFNINSTSVDAWKALLASLSGKDLRVFSSNSGSAQTLTASTLANPIPRFWSSANNGAVNQPWEGVRTLTDAELTTLATSIVQQVKLRGPFLSLSDFLNRRLGPASNPLSLAGALQAAIDNTPLNNSVKSAGSTVNASGPGLNAPNPVRRAFDVIPANLRDGANNQLNSTVGMPGYLMQQDLVQALSPAFAARSDTFVIRTYGETVNPATGATEGRAWAEAVVQRVPEFVDPSLPAETDLATAPASDARTTNQTFGRRFVVTSFRWLSPDDL